MCYGLKVENGTCTLFWFDRFGSVKFLFRSLFFGYLSCLIINFQLWRKCTSWGRMGGWEAWKWRQRLRAWEEEQVVECRLLLLSVVLQVNINDVCLWTPDSVAGYTVSGAYYSLMSDISNTSNAPPAPASTIWKKDVPLKVSIFAWQLFRDRLPRKVNLFRRRIIQEDAQLCVYGCGMLESADHLFLHCQVFGQVWQLV